jgi:hypothetical protein
MVPTDYAGPPLGPHCLNPRRIPLPGVTMLGMAPLRIENDPGTAPAVVRTFADGEEFVRTWSRLRRVEWRVPTGLVHAVDLDGEAALCGRPVTALAEFGRSRYPFERVPHEERCPACDEAAGSPSV